MNCWEFQECERQPGGRKSAEIGTCPAATETILDGINDGKNGGRACWAVAGTICGGEVRGTIAQKIGGCLGCDFYSFVWKQQKDQFVSSVRILAMLKTTSD